MKEELFLKGKSFLITQPMIRSFCGSTMVTLELAKYLLSAGARVVVYTNVMLAPASASFEDAGIEVVSPKDDFNFSLKDFDYVWVHSLTIPCQLLDELKYSHKKMPAFIFLHMSPLDIIPDEHPWIYNLENILSTISLYISEGTLESNKKYGLPSRVGFFRNPAPLEFQDLIGRKISREIRRLLVVSNHPPTEVIKAKGILADRGIRVDFYGDGQDQYMPLLPAVLKKYDAVITIGKTVQYCIVGSLPVYIYDWFGGPGWLTASNYEHSKYNNFSGRFSGDKTGEEIAKEIIEGYPDALDFHMGFLARNNKEFIMDYALDDLLSNLKPRKFDVLDSEYIESVKAAVRCAEIRFIASEELGNMRDYCKDLVYQIDNYKKQVNKYRKKYDDLAGSKRMKFLDNILKPHDIIKDNFTRNIKQQEKK